MERRAVFDPKAPEADEDFVVEWDETDADAEDIDARETAMRDFGDRLLDD
jgi:hypothetical protein